MKKHCLIISVFSLLSFTHCSAYYSQVGQDRYLNENVFKNKTNGVFIDIGAHDGVHFSNTKFFEDLGWTGICFEPLSKPFKKLAAHRKCIAINACIAPVEGMISFVEVKSSYFPTEMLSGMLSTYDPRHLERLKAEIAAYGGSYSIKDVPAYRFNDVMKKYNIYKIDYLSIDTEGSELEILKSIDFDTYYIYAISVENIYAGSSMREFLESKGFKHITNVEWDEIYINAH